MATPDEIRAAIRAFKAANPGATPDQVKSAIRTQFPEPGDAPAAPKTVVEPSRHLPGRQRTVTEALRVAPSKAEVSDAIRRTRELQGASYTDESAGRVKVLKQDAAALDKAAKYAEVSGVQGEYDLPALRKVAAVLDAPHHLVRQTTKKLFSEKPYEMYSADVSNDEWSDSVRRAAAGDGLKGALASAALAAPRAFAGAVAPAIGGATGLVGAALDIPSVLRGEQTLADVGRNIGASITDETTKKEIENFGLQFMSDPTNAVTFGQGSAAKTLGKQAGSIATRGALTNPALFEKGLPKVFEKLAGTPRFWPAVQKVYKASGGTDMKVLEDVLGAGGDFAGKAGLELGVPFMGDRARVDVGSKLADAFGVPQQATRRALTAVGDTARGAHAAVAKNLGTAVPVQGSRHLREFADAQHRISTHRSNAMVTEATEFYRQKVAPLAADIPKARQKEIVGMMDPAKGFSPPTGLTPDEAKYARAIGDFYLGAGAQLKKAGVIKNLHANRTTGEFIPRIWNADAKTAPEKAFRKIFPAKSQYKPLTERTGLDTAALGGGSVPGMTAQLDPDKIAAEWIPRMARALENSRYKDVVTKAFASAGHEVTPELLSRFENAAHRVSWPVWDGFLSLFKSQQLQGSPRYHLVNMIEDTAKMVMNGFADVKAIFTAKKAFGKDIADAAIAFDTPSGRSVTYGELRRHIRDNGYREIASSHDAFDNSVDELAGTFSAATAKAEGKGRLGQFAAQYGDNKLGGVREVFKDVSTLGARRPGSKLGKEWDNYSKTAFFIDRMKKGDSALRAGTEVSRVLYDAAMQGPGLQRLKRVMPFAPYTVKSAQHVPRMVAKNPGAALLPVRALDAMTNDDMKAPSYVEESGFTGNLNPGGQQLMRKAADAFGPTPRENQPYTVRARGIPLEGLALPAEALLNGNLAPIGSQFAPPIQWTAEGLLGRDILTKRPQELPGPSDILPSGFGPTSLQAPEGTVAMSQLLGRNLLGPVGELVGDAAARQMGAESDVFSKGADYSEKSDRRAALKLLDLIFAVSGQETSPLQKVQNQFDATEVQRALPIPSNVRREKKRQKDKK